MSATRAIWRPWSCVWICYGELWQWPAAESKLTHSPHAPGGRSECGRSAEKPSLHVGLWCWQRAPIRSAALPRILLRPREQPGWPLAAGRCRLQASATAGVGQSVRASERARAEVRPDSAATPSSKFVFSASGWDDVLRRASAAFANCAVGHRLLESFLFATAEQREP